MLSTKATTLLLVAIIGVSFADPLQDRRSNKNSTSESWYGQNPDHQHSINTASHFGQNSGYQNSAADTWRNNRQSYPQKPISTESPFNLHFAKLFPEIKPFETTPDLKRVYNGIDSQLPAGSGLKNYYGSITVQKGNSYNVDPNSTNIFGSVTHISGSYLSPTEQEQLDRWDQLSLGSDDSEPFETTPDLKRVYDGIDSQLPAGSGSKNYYGSITVQKGNSYNVDPNSTNIFGSVTHISGSYLSPTEQEQLDRWDQLSLGSDDSEPFETTPDLNRVHDDIDSQHLAGSGPKINYGSITVQKGNSYNVVPNSTNIFGSVTHISGSYLSPTEQEQFDRLDQLSLGSDDSESKSFQTRDAKTVNMHGAVTYQTNTAYTPQLCYLYGLAILMSYNFLKN